MSDLLMTPNQLDLAVSGLAGIVGALLFPTMGAWLRLVLRWLETDRAVLTRPRRLSGLELMRAGVATIALAFFVLSLGRAAAELREVRIEAPVFASTIQGLFIGLVLGVAYGIALRTLRNDIKLLRRRRRIR